MSLEPTSEKQISAFRAIYGEEAYNQVVVKRGFEKRPYTVETAKKLEKDFTYYSKKKQEMRHERWQKKYGKEAFKAVVVAKGFTEKVYTEKEKLKLRDEIRTAFQKRRHDRWKKNYGKAAELVLSRIPVYPESKRLIVKRKIAFEKKKELLEKIGTPLYNFLIKRQVGVRDYLWAAVEIEKEIEKRTPKELEELKNVQTEEEAGALFSRFCQREENLKILADLKSEFPSQAFFLDTYFSYLKEGRIKADKQFIQTVLLREKAQQEMNFFANEKLILNMPEKGHEKIPAIVGYIVQDQISFSRYLIRLKKYDLYQKLYSEGEDLLKKEPLNLELQECLKKEPLNLGLQECLKKIQGKIEKLSIQAVPEVNERVHLTAKDLATHGPFRQKLDIQNAVEKLISFDQEMFLLSESSPQEVVIRAEKEAYVQHLQAMIRLRNERQQNFSTEFADASDQELAEKVEAIMQEEYQELFRPFIEKVSHLESEIQKATGSQKQLLEIQKKTLESIQVDAPSFSPLQKKLTSYYVIPLDFEGSGAILTPEPPNDGIVPKWVVIDLTDIRDELSSDLKKAVFHESFLRGALQNKAPGERSLFAFKDGKLLPSEDGKIKIFYEDPKKVVKSDNLDFGQKVRLVEKERIRSWFPCLCPKDFIPEELHYGDYFRSTRAADSNQKWTLNKLRTAAVDRLEAIWISRLIMKGLISGKKVDLRTFQSAYGHHLAVQTSDLANLNGSYGEDPVFLEAIHMMGKLSQPLVDLMKEETELQTLEADVQEGEEGRKYNPKIAIRALHEVYQTIEVWTKNIEKMVDLSGKHSFLAEPFIVYLNKLQNIYGLLKSKEKGFSFLKPYSTVPNCNTVQEVIEIDEAIKKALELLPPFFNELQLLSIDLAIPESSESLKEKRREILLTLKEKYEGNFNKYKESLSDLKERYDENSDEYKKRDSVLKEKYKPQEYEAICEFGKAADVAFPKFFQTFPRLKLAVEEFAKNFSVFSSDKLRIQELSSEVSNQNIEMEILRMNQTKDLVSRLQRERSSAKAYFYPDSNSLFNLS